MHDLAAQPFVGFRIFRVTPDGMLTSVTGPRLGQHAVWHPGQIMESTCTHARAHGPIAPALECTCGIWAVKSRRDMSRTYPTLAQQALTYHLNNRLFARQQKVKKSELRKLLYDVPVRGHRTMAQPYTMNFAPVVKSLMGPEQRYDFVSARVYLWGIVHEHQRGYRAQFAQIIPETIRWWPRQGAWFKPKFLKYIIDKYTVEEGGETDEPDDLS